MVPERPLKVLATRRPAAGGLVAAKPQPEEPWAGVPVAVWAGFWTDRLHGGGRRGDSWEVRACSYDGDDDGDGHGDYYDGDGWC